MITLEEISFRIGDRYLLHPLDLHFPQGEVCALVGHNGSGKSTLLKLLARQQRPETGRILLSGRDVATIGRREFAREVAYLPQQPPATSSSKFRSRPSSPVSSGYSWDWH